ncbi:MAG: hypothetical protein J5725_00445 [Bacteroidales bacterium]|nr:hypothetical protein [Bacteroidales bacterium]
MTSYELTKSAVQTINPAIQYADKELLVNIFTIVIDKYCSDHHMSCVQKCDFVAEILKNFEELKNNV